MRIGVALGLCTLLNTTLGAQTPRLTLAPERPDPGAIVRIALERASSSDSIASVRGTMAGEPLHFMLIGGSWNAIGPVPVDATKNIVAAIVVEYRSGSVDTLRAVVEPPPPPPARSTERLGVERRFTQPLDAATAKRIEQEAARARDIGRRSHSTPPLWSEPFLPPRESTITSQFGSGRTFNGTVTSRHLGVDFRGALGAPVLAANRGVVALVDTFYLAGKVVYIDHGAGVTTGYFHLSEPLVVVGDTVARGQTVGLVGATGRVTGPHLHWAARYGALTVNPLDLLAIAAEWYSAPARPELE